MWRPTPATDTPAAQQFEHPARRHRPTDVLVSQRNPRTWQVLPPDTSRPPSSFRHLQRPQPKGQRMDNLALLDLGPWQVHRHILTEHVAALTPKIVVRAETSRTARIRCIAIHRAECRPAKTPQGTRMRFA